MSGQGYHLALDSDQAKELLSLDDEMEILDWVDQLLTKVWNEEDTTPIAGGYKDWNILLCCLTNGSYDPEGGTYPLNRCFFGGQLLVRDGSIVNLVIAEEVREVAEALGNFSQAELTERSLRLWPELSGDDEYGAYLCEILEELREFYHRSAQESRAVMFYTDDPLDYFFKSDSTPGSGTDDSHHS
jgi:hypothetical protein